ncbi:dnaJ homolog subfamily C member 21-like [Corticium candelabrum]|uniref:dnaJ homolog subfamily C member 21-like n=1 Tax=Corticium candelabrum TaxID=121492 RepID=UPI002E261F30|nr:dnaJ homolog subfamily C member 21-like [Corticium candelabrum]
MRCHYEVLSVSRSATDDEIKRSYRRLALEWHPDKNPDSQEECHHVFSQIQQAYDILSDPHERAWYDKYREVILRGRGDDYDDDTIDLMPYFQPSVYSGYTDDEKGFYAVFQKVFKTISEEDTRDVDLQSQEEKIPEFGNSTSSYDDVVHLFYGYWQSYCTKLSFLWKDTFDVREAPDRYTARKMEKENKKVRDASKKERNEVVRRLVAFVRKRDPRVKARQQQLKERQEEIAKKTADERRRQREERLKEMAEPYKEQEWMSGVEDGLRAVEHHLKQEFSDDSSDNTNSDDPTNPNGSLNIDGDIEEILDDLYCIACSKSFRSSKAMDNHKKSKKHRESVTILTQQLAEEDSHIDNYFTLCEDKDDAIEQDRTTNVRSRKPKKKKRRTKDAVPTETDEALPSLDSLTLRDAIPEDQLQACRDSAPNAAASECESVGCTLYCNTCGNGYPSRNKLFQHLKETKHALQVEGGATAQGGKKKKKAGRKLK